ncbi:insulysin, partial [Nematocida sp. LUAm1]
MMRTVEFKRTNHFLKKKAIVSYVIAAILLVLGLVAFYYRRTDSSILMQIYGENDPVEYKEFTLPNGMRVVLAKNQDTTHSAACLSVWAGFWSDPKEHAGMAHFLEHMVLRGSEKYPEPYYFQKYIVKNGGGTNAMTSAYITTYYFTIPSSKFEQGLDMFSEFLKHPIFDAGSIERELEAIYSEVDMRKSTDFIRSIYTLDSLIKDNIPELTSNAGSKESLSNVKREQLISFWKYYYRPERMCLTIYTPEDFETMKSYAEKYFSDVKAHENAPWVFEGEPPAVPSFPINGPSEKSYDTVFQEALSDKVVIQRPFDKNSEVHTLTVTLPLPATMYNFKEQIPQFLHAMMNMGGEKNIYNILEKKELINSHSIQQAENPKLSPVNLIFTLPNPSMESISSILNLIGEQLEMIEKNVSESLYNYYKEERKTAIQYLTMPSAVDISLIASSMRFYVPLKYAFTHNYIWDKYNSSKFQEFLKIAQDKSRWAVILYTNSLFTKETPQKEPILGVEYLVKERASKTDESIDAVSSMLTWNEPQNKEPIEFEAAYMDKKSLEFGTPVKNIFIPEDTTTEEHTVLEHIAPGYKGYYISKKTKKLINVLGHMTIDTPQIFDSIESYVGVLGHLFAFIPSFYNKYQEEFIRANTSIYVFISVNGQITITFSCDPFNACDLLTKFFTEYQISPAYLGSSISRKAQEYLQMSKSGHLYKAHPIYAIIKSKNIPFFDIDECLVVAKRIKAEDVTPVSEGEIKLYLFGNTCKEEFEELNEVITRFITPKEGTLKTKKPYLKKVNMGTSDPENQVIALVHHVDIPSAYKSYIVASLLGIIKNGDFCEKLRGQECAGYALGMHRIQIAKENSVILFVQTTKSS